MKRVILLIAMIAALAGMGGTAQAQTSTCGGSATADGWLHSGPPTKWTYFVSANCGNDKTFLVQLQASTNGSSGWTTQSQVWITTQPLDANHWVQYTIIDYDGPSASCSLYYRVRVNWADGSDATGGRKDPSC